MLNDNTNQYLKQLGDRLRQERIRRGDTQRVFAARLSISIPTLKKMEDGDQCVQIGHWAAALEVMGREADLGQILSQPEDLFAKYSVAQALPQRKRVRRRSAG